MFETLEDAFEKSKPPLDREHPIFSIERSALFLAVSMAGRRLTTRNRMSRRSTPRL